MVIGGKNVYSACILSKLLYNLYFRKFLLVDFTRSCKYGNILIIDEFSRIINCDGSVVNVPATFPISQT